MFVIDKYLSPVVCSIMPLNNELNKGFILISIKFIKIIKQVIIPKTFKRVIIVFEILPKNSFIILVLFIF